MRINKFLSMCELGSRRSVEKLIVNKQIVVNGRILEDLSYNVKPEDDVEFKGKKLKVQENKVYLMLNKPKCYITSTKDEKDRKVVTDLLKNFKYKVFPVGRLDYNTTGLLLLTNDGDWANNIIHPSKHINKTYEVKLKVMPTNKQLNMIRNGIVIDGKKTLPAIVKVLDFDGVYYILNITIFEGRNREIRKMFEFINIKIYELKRIAIGDLMLDDLEIGKYRILNNEEKMMVFGGDLC